MNNQEFPKALTIAGFDGSGGAGIQADLKVFSAFGCYGMSVLTALPIQNTTGVRSCYNIELQAVLEQLETIFDDIMPDVVKIGMLFNTEIIETVAKFLKLRFPSGPIIVDPVMVAKSGDRLLLPEAVDALKTCILPLATVITPNIPEATTLTGIDIQGVDQMQEAARKIIEFGASAVFIKGGHLENINSSADFYIDDGGESELISMPRIQTRNNHGTGCTLSAAIASCMGLGFDKLQSCLIAKKYLYNALEAASNLSIGKGAGPVHHFYHIWPAININEVSSLNRFLANETSS